MRGDWQWGSLADTEEDMTLPERYCSAVGTYCLHAHNGLLHLGDIRDVVLIGLELLLLYPFVDAYHQFSGDVCAIIHACSVRREVGRWRKDVLEACSQRGEAPTRLMLPKGGLDFVLSLFQSLQWLAAHIH